MSDDDSIVKETLATINQFMEYKHPEAAKFIVFTMLYDEEKLYLLAYFTGVQLSRVKILCRPFGLSKAYFEYVLSRIEMFISRIIKMVNNRLNNLHICEKCMDEMAKYRRFVSTVHIYAEGCDHSHSLDLTIASILEPSLERQENVVDVLRPLPLPISQEIIHYFVT